MQVLNKIFVWIKLKSSKNLFQSNKYLFQYRKLITSLQRIKNLPVKKETLLTVPGFEPGSFDCRSIQLYHPNCKIINNRVHLFDNWFVWQGIRLMCILIENFSPQFEFVMCFSIVQLLKFRNVDSFSYNSYVINPQWR